MVPGVLNELRSERLHLRRPGEVDRDDFVKMNRDAEVMATLGGVRSEAAANAGYDRLLAHWNAHDYGYWIVRDLETDRFAGRAGLRMLVVAGVPEIELGYGFMGEFWGRGLATEVSRECVRAAFAVIEVEELVCFTSTTNHKSRNVMEKVGFRYEKDFSHAGIPHSLCRLERERWRKART